MSDRLRRHRWIALSAAAPLALIALAVLYGASGPVSLQGTVTTALCNLVLVLGTQVFIGNSGIYSFGQLAFAAVGAYIGALLTIPAAFAALQTPSLPALIVEAAPAPLPAIVISALLGGALALIVGLPIMRTSTLAIPISTFALLIVVFNVISNWDAVTGGSAGLVSIPATTGVVSAGLWAAISVLIALAYKRSAWGYRLIATREDEQAARSIGIRVTRERMISFGLSGFLCGAGGALAVHASGVLGPGTFYFGATVTLLTMLVLGGSRSVLGAVIGAFTISALTELFHGVEGGVNLGGFLAIGETPGLAPIGLGVVLLLTMIGMPDGMSRGVEAGDLGPRAASLPHQRPVAARAENRILRPDHGLAETLEVERASLAFAGLQVLDDVDLQLRSGEILGLIGPNGAGKTTLVNVVSGFQSPDSGRVSLDGRDVTGRAPEWLARAGVTRSFQAALPFPLLSGLENVAIGAMGVGQRRKQSIAAAAAVLDQLGFLDQREHLRAASLPPGTQRFLGIARALAAAPRFLLLDEPAAGLNEAECEGLSAMLSRIVDDFACGILLIEHDMSVVMRACQRVQVLEQGRTLRIGSPEEVRTDAAVLEAYLGSSFEVAPVA